MKELFDIGTRYSRKEVRAILEIDNPDQIGGIWSTGYIKHENFFYIFATISDSGRTGHNYNNSLSDNILYWYIKGSHTFESNTVAEMMSGHYPVRIFCRYNGKDPKFEYFGYGKLADYSSENGNQICWELTPKDDATSRKHRRLFVEGKKIEQLVNRYERDPRARESCLSFYGYTCIVCDFNFEEIYGELGTNFIHVHHLKELSKVGENYQIDPINDLRPVCPNCHAMIHRNTSGPMLSINELKTIMKERK